MKNKLKILGIVLVLLITTVIPIQTTNADDGVIPIYTAEELNNIRHGLTGNYILMNNIDLSNFTNWLPIGNQSIPFRGTLNGNGYTISNLSINRPSTSSVGLFGFTLGATFSNINLKDVNISGSSDVGGLVGTALISTNIINTSVTGNIQGNNSVGGIVGYISQASIIEHSFASVHINGLINVGGLAGYASFNSKINDSFFLELLPGIEMLVD